MPDCCGPEDVVREDLVGDSSKNAGDSAGKTAPYEGVRFQELPLLVAHPKIPDAVPEAQARLVPVAVLEPSRLRGRYRGASSWSS